jgi:two-component system NtrC family response regulator
VTAGDLGLAEAEPEESRPSTLKETVEEAERRALTRAWAEADGNVSKASKLLGVSRPTVYKLLRTHGLLEAGELPGPARPGLDRG